MNPSTGRAFVRAAVRWISPLHRWIGVAASLLCVMWFTSGLVMMYVPFPKWSDADRLAALAPLDSSLIAVPPEKALATAALPTQPNVFRLEMWGREPVYRIATYSSATAISALDGRPISHVGIDDARARLAEIFPDQDPRLLERVDRDQWTVSSTFNVHRPLYLFSLNDDAGTRIYISSRTGEVVQKTTATARFWNYLGAIPHWIYFTSIRSDGGIWRQVVLWTAAPVIFLAISGLWLGVSRMRRRTNVKDLSPFRGWMRWHHLSGLIGGIFLTTWITTGWLSVNPFGLFSNLPPLFFNIPSYYSDRPAPFSIPVEQLRSLATENKAKEISFSWLANEPLMVMNDGSKRTTINGKDGAPYILSDDAARHAAQRLLPDSRIVLQNRLTREDVYWYSHRIERQLPVIRIGFDDPGATWVHLDPANGAVLSVQDQDQRTYRWIFNLLHDADLPFLLRNRPLWDLVMWVLLLSGLAISVTGLVQGCKLVLRKMGAARSWHRVKKRRKRADSSACFKCYSVWSKLLKKQKHSARMSTS